MHTILEYVGITLVFIFILLVMGYYMSVPLTSLSAIKSEQLLYVGQRILNTIVLTTGDPKDWGKRIGDPTSFGLKLENISVGLYVLSSDKITRLANGSVYGREFYNPFYIDKEKVSRILGINKSYGFRIELEPILNIRIICNKQDFPDKINVYVYDRRNMTLPGINVTLYYIIVKWESDEINTTVIIRERVSSITGECSFNLSSYFSNINKNDIIGYVIVAKATHYWSMSVALSEVGNYSLATLIGRSLYVDSSLTNGTIKHIDHVKTVFNNSKSCTSSVTGNCTELVPQVYPDVTPLFLINVSEPTTYNTGDKTFYNYTLEFVDYASYIVMMVVSDDNNVCRLVVAVRPPLIKYGYVVPKGNVETSECFVNIAYSYVLRLYIWRTEI